MQKPPQRPWDFYLDKYGGCYFWFKEMVYVDGTSVPKELKVEEGTTTLLRAGQWTGGYYMNLKLSACKDCDRCLQNKLCEKFIFDAPVQKAFSDWMFDLFESSVIGNKDDN